MATVADRDLDTLFRALDAELRRLGAAPVELCVIGGFALIAAGLAARPTKDVDVVAIATRDDEGLSLAKPRPLPGRVAEAVAAVAAQFGLEGGWLNTGPADLVDHGLPAGFEGRLVSRGYGDVLTVHFAGRLDQICFKTFAAADSAGRHLTDLLELAPAHDELRFAALWIADQDTLDGFRARLNELLAYMGVPDVVVEL